MLINKNIPDVMIPTNSNGTQRNFLVNDILLEPTVTSDGYVQIKNITTTTNLQLGDLGYSTNSNQTSGSGISRGDNGMSNIIPIIIFSTLGGLILLLAIVLFIYISKRRKNDNASDMSDGFSW